MEFVRGFMTEELMANLEVNVDTEALIDHLNARIEAGDIRIELCGLLECVDNIKGFTLDKTKYRLRLTDETETSVKVLIEPK